MPLIGDDKERLAWRDISTYVPTGTTQLIERLRAGIVDNPYNKTSDIEFIRSEDTLRIVSLWYKANKYGSAKPGSGGFQGDMPMASLLAQNAIRIPTMLPLLVGLDDYSAYVNEQTVLYNSRKTLWICVLQIRKLVDKKARLYLPDPRGDIKIGQTTFHRARYQSNQSGTALGIRLTDSHIPADMRVMFPAPAGLQDKDYHKTLSFDRIWVDREWFFWNVAIEGWICAKSIEQGLQEQRCCDDSVVLGAQLDGPLSAIWADS